MSVIENFVCYVKTSLDNCFLTFALNPFLKIICIWDLLLLRFLKGYLTMNVNVLISFFQWF